MHKNMEGHEDFPKAITEHQNLGDLSVNIVKTENYNFPHFALLQLHNTLLNTLALAQAQCQMNSP